MDESTGAFLLLLNLVGFDRRESTVRVDLTDLIFGGALDILTVEPLLLAASEAIVLTEVIVFVGAFFSVEAFVGDFSMTLDSFPTACAFSFLGR